MLRKLCPTADAFRLDAGRNTLQGTSKAARHQQGWVFPAIGVGHLARGQAYSGFFFGAAEWV